MNNHETYWFISLTIIHSFYFNSMVYNNNIIAAADTESNEHTKHAMCDKYDKGEQLGCTTTKNSCIYRGEKA